jgi:hypothetical protein
LTSKQQANYKSFFGIYAVKYAEFNCRGQIRTLHEPLSLVL